MSEWISVEDRLPDVNLVVLVSDGLDYSVARFWPLIERWLTNNMSSECCFTPTYWMLLPEPPKEKQQ